MLRIDTSVELGGIQNLETRLRSEELVREIALIAEQVFVDQSPVDTGLLRANFFVSDYIENKQLKRTSHQPSIPPTKRPVLYVLNNIDYALYANVTSYRPQYIETSLSIIRAEIERINLER